MFKTKLGISVGLMGAIACFLGLIMGISWPLLAIVAYILIKEDNEWLRRLTIKVILILVFIAMVPQILGCIEYIFTFINRIADDELLKWPFDLDKYIYDAVFFLGRAILILMGIKAFKQGHLAVKPIDKIISKNV